MSKLIVQKPYEETEIFNASDFSTALTSIETFINNPNLDASNFQLGSVGATEFSDTFGDGVTIDAALPSKVADDSITTTHLAEGAITNTEVADALITNDKLFDFQLRAQAFSISVSSLTNSFQNIGSFTSQNGRPFLVYLFSVAGSNSAVATVNKTSTVRNSASLVIDVGLKQNTTELSYGRFEVTHTQSSGTVSVPAAVFDTPPNHFCLFHDPSTNPDYMLANDSDEGSSYFYVKPNASAVTYTLEAKYGGDATSATLTDVRGVVIEL